MLDRILRAVLIVIAMVAITAADGSGSLEAAPADPVDALKRQFAAGRGVMVTTKLTVTKKGETIELGSSGAADFGPRGITATDLTAAMPAGVFSAFTGASPRAVTVQGHRYIKDDTAQVSKGWQENGDAAVRPCLDATWTLLADPAMLAAVLATTTSRSRAGVYDGTPTVLHEGVITLGALHRARPQPCDDLDPTAPRGATAEAKVSWRMWIGEDRLVRRAWAAWDGVSEKGRLLYTNVSDAWLTAWGARPDIEVPAIEPQAG
ncbi:hypothetical protein DP939_35735 [Spongiactinospora rosea]|uniref:Lipoprotein n=1 Tax=Spongiactinospora rosea TaxID=2248750 RepID=A0A366LPJ4_9ACTN|nr:hypothetical protein [Spongiactinospora rosea]RBQ15443.1 hypothetical protein DP939_35735 [Spongiactinospora rosea]